MFASLRFGDFRRLVFGVVLGLIVVGPSTGFGRPVSQTPFTVSQPDGTTILLYGRGDEVASWMEDQNGFAVCQVDKTYYYATLNSEGRFAATEFVAGKVNPAAVGLRPNIHPNLDAIRLARQARWVKVIGAAKVPTSGTVKMLIIPIRFSNHKSRNLPTKAAWETLFNTGDHSFKKYYSECSYGKLTMETVVTDWVDVDQTEAQAAANLEPVLVAALNKVDANGFNFKQFDNNKTGEVDIMTFVHSGYDSATSGEDEDGTPSKKRIWSHAFAISAWTAKDGTKVESYNINAGLEGLSGSKQCAINTPVHEVGHVLGLPDLYDINKTSTGLGLWCVMADCDGPGGDHVPFLCAWCRVRLGWVTPTIIAEDGNYSVKDAAKNADVFKIQQGYPFGEYLLIENREPGKWESKLPAGKGGLMIWHIDEKVGSISQNDVNAYPAKPDTNDFRTHYRVALIQADGYYHLERKEDPNSNDMFRKGDRTSVGPSTTPNTMAYQTGVLKNTNVRISAIGEAGATMNFKATLDSSPSLSSIPNVGVGGESGSASTLKQAGEEVAVFTGKMGTGPGPEPDFSDEFLPNETEGPMSDIGIVEVDDPAGPNIGGGGEGIDMTKLGGGIPEFVFPPEEDIDHDGQDDDLVYGYDYEEVIPGPEVGDPANPYKGNGSRYVIPLKVDDDAVKDVTRLLFLVTSNAPGIVNSGDVQVVPATLELLEEARNAGLKYFPDDANVVLIITPRGTGPATLKVGVGDGLVRASEKFTLNAAPDFNGDGTTDTGPLSQCWARIFGPLSCTGLGLVLVLTCTMMIVGSKPR
jgi:M6 family metalloprotease-like protein